MTVPLALIEYAAAVARALSAIPEPDNIYVEKVTFGWYGESYDQVSVQPIDGVDEYGLSFPGDES